MHLITLLVAFITGSDILLSTASDISYNFKNGNYGDLTTNCLLQPRSVQEIKRIDNLNVSKPDGSDYVFYISNGIGCIETGFVNLNNVELELEYYAFGNYADIQILVQNYEGIAIETRIFKSLIKNKWNVLKTKFASTRKVSLFKVILFCFSFF